MIDNEESLNRALESWTVFLPSEKEIHSLVEDFRKCLKENQRMRGKLYELAQTNLQEIIFGDGWK